MKKSYLFLMVLFLGTAPMVWAQTTWNGSANLDWNNAANWSSGVPTSSSSAVIAFVASGKFPELTADAAVGSLQINSDAQITFVSGTITIYNSINCDGPIFGSPGFSVVLGSSASGSSTLNFDQGSNDWPFATLASLINNGSGSVSIASNLTVDNLAIYGTGGVLIGTSPNTGISLKVNTNLTFAGSGELDINANKLTINGSITNTVAERITSHNGLLVLGGSTAQTLSLDQSDNGNTNNIFDFTMNNGGGVTLANNLVLTNNAQFVLGIITAPTATSLVDFGPGVWESDPSNPEVNGVNSSGANFYASNACYVNGYVRKRQVTDIGFIFPVGDANHYGPLAMAINNNPDGIVVKYFAGTPTGGNTMGAGINNVNKLEYWDVSTGGGAAANVGVFWDDHNNAGTKYGVNTADLVVARLIGGEWVAATGTSTRKQDVDNGFVFNDENSDPSGAYTLGSSNGGTLLATSTGINWNGSVSTDWYTAANWDGGAVPTSTSQAVIPSLALRYPVLTADVSVGALKINSGAGMDLGNGGAYTLTINDSLIGDGLLIGYPKSGIIFGTSASGASILNFNQGSGDFSFATLANLTINGTGGVALGSNLTVGTNITFGGSGKLALNGKTFTLNGDITNTVAEGITGGATSSLVLGSSTVQFLSMDQTIPSTTNQLFNITFNNTDFIVQTNPLGMVSGGTTTLAGSKTVFNTNSLTFASGANIVRSGAGTFNIAPTFAGPVNLTYTNVADIVASNEIPLGLVNLNNLTLSNTATINLDPSGSGFGNSYADANVNGLLLQTGSGILNLHGNALMIVGGFIKTGTGTITASEPGSVVTFANPVSITLPANAFTDGGVAGMDYLTMNGSGGIILSDNICVNMTATFMNGIITAPSTSSLLKFQWGANAVATSDISHVNGYVNKLASGNDGPFTYPVGDAIRYQPIIIQMSFVFGSDFGLVAKYVAGTPGQYPLDGTINNLNLSEYWDVEPINSTLGDGNVTVFWDNYNNVGINNQADQSNLTVAKLTNGSWMNAGRSNGGIPYGALGGGIASNTMNTWGPVTLGSISSATILPVTLTSFTATASGCTANLAWQTATESNSGFYAVEAGTDGAEFSQVGSMASKNNATGASYTYRCALGKGTNYFRLKVVDLDGKFSYSNIVAVKGTGACGTWPQIVVSPNPANNIVNIQNLDGGRNLISLCDMGGKVLTEITTTAIHQSINIASYANGLYLLRIKSANGKVVTVKVIKQ